MKKIELKIVALSSSSNPTHYYAVVLSEVKGSRRLPIVIGAFEAQAIVVALEEIKPTRPLTHDLFYNFLLSFNIDLEQVLIYKLEEGIFYARLYCRLDDKIMEIDSRTSDALALAIRVGCPIYTYESILEKAGMLMDPTSTGVTPTAQPEVPEESSAEEDSSDLTRYTLPELEERLKDVLEKEDYMKAVALRDEIKRRKEDL